MLLLVAMGARFDITYPKKPKEQYFTMLLPNNALVVRRHTTQPTAERLR
jgi:hypothetical protein